jgi:hypothetical protein
MTAPPTRFKTAITKDPAKAMPSEEDLAEIAAAVNEVADSNNVGSVVRPSDAPPASATAAALPKKEKPTRAQHAAPSGKLSVEVPVYLLEAIDRKRNLTKTKRYIVLKAFKDAGYEVREADFKEDGRRGRA